MPEALTSPTPMTAPPLSLSEAESKALGSRQRAADMDLRWSVKINGDRLFLLRCGRHAIFDATFAAAQGTRSLVELMVEGDFNVFKRSGFSGDAEVAALFVTLVQRLALND